MFKRNFKLYIITLLVLVGGIASAGLISRFTTFTDGTVLTAADLNGEFNQIVNLVNGNLDNDNLSASAAISPAKITAAIAGDGLSRNGSTGALAVNPDGSTIEVSGDAVQIKDDGVTYAKIQEEVGLTVIGTATAASGNFAGITAGTDGYVFRRSGTTLGFGTVATAGIADDAVTQAKLGDVNSSASSGSGSFSTASTSLVDVTNLSVTITTTGRPVMLLLATDSTATTCTGNCAQGSISGTSSGSDTRAVVAFLRSSTVISSWNVGTFVGGAGVTSHTSNSPCSAFQVLDAAVAAGTYTYKVQVSTGGVSDSVRVQTCKFTALEL